MNNTPSIVYIEWIDSGYCASSWTKIGDVEFKKEHLEYVSVGFLMKETEYSYAIVQSKNLDLAETENIHSVMEIPKIAVTHIRVLNADDPVALNPIIP